jgi:hypothetical protein
VLKIATIGESSPAFAVEAARLRAFSEIFFALDRQIAITVETMAAVGIPREYVVIALLHAAGLRPYLLNNTRSFVAEYDRHRKTKRSLDYLEIGVAQACRANSHKNIGRL